VPLIVVSILVIVLGAVALAARGGGSEGNPTTASTAPKSKPEHRVRYTVEVDKSCDDFDTGYDDIDVGTEVEVVDGSGTLLGVGEIVHAYPSGARCQYSSEFFDVKKAEDGFYRVTAGNENRGYLNKSEEDFSGSGTLVVNASLG
jgi:hypothetical protein